MRLDDLNTGQRIVLVIASGAVLLVAAWWIVIEDSARGGWFGYTPNTNPVFPDGHVFRFSQTVVALVLIAATVLWTAIGLRLLRGPRRSPAADTTT